MSAVLLTVISCGDDDNAPIIDFEERDRAEQQITDDSTLVAYLNTHYYNSSFFESGSNHTYNDIIITELTEGETVPDGHTLLFDAVGNDPITTTYLDVEYKYYVLNLNQGGGGSPNFTDRIFMRYEGTSVNTDEVFDVVASPISLNLQSNLISTSGVIKGWQLVIPDFNAAVDFAIVNGFVNYVDYGLGVMFLPSGLGYFSGTNTGTSYDNLLFKFELLRFEQEDHDGDGIPSFIEDINSDQEVTDDDTDEDGLPDFIDADDDGDGVATRDELIFNIYTEDGEMMPFISETDAKDYFDNNAITNEVLISINFNSETSSYEINTVILIDSDNDDMPDYLQEDIAINYNEESED